MSPNINYRLSMIIMCQCRFFSCNKCTTPVKDVDSEEVVHVRGQGVCGNSIVSPQFCYESKTTLKIESIYELKKEYD